MKTLTVPWAISDPPRSKPFTESMEAASILCLVDSRRRRPKILKSRAETISYLAKLHYPFWTVPHGEGCLIVDGIGLLSHSMKDLKIPDIKSFSEDLKRATTDFSLYRKTIDKHIQTFVDFASKSELRIEALVGDLEVLKVVGELLRGGLRSENQQAETSTIVLKVGEEEALEKSKRLINVRVANLSDIRGLQYAIDILKEEMERHREKIMTEMDEIKRRYDTKLQELEPIVNEKIKQLKADEDSKIKKTLGKQEKRLKAALKEQEKLKREIMRLEKRTENYLARRRTLKQKNKSYIDAKIEICRNRMKETSERIKVISKIAETIRREGDESIKMIRDEYEGRIKKENDRINLLEASREAEVSMLRSEIEDLSMKTSTIRTNLMQLIEKKRRVISELDSITFPANVKEATLICAPFYAVKYKAGELERLEAFPQINPISHDGLALRLRRAVKPTLESRIRLLLRTRSEVLERRVFAAFEGRVLEDAALKEIVDKVAEQHNLLRSSSFMSMVVEGTKELMEEGWIEERERKEILEEYAT